MLACYLTWHLRRAWAPLTFTDEHPPQPGQPGRPGPPLRRRPGQSLRPARCGRPALPQLPRPARAPGHPAPQPGPVHRRHRRRADAHRADQRPARGLRPDRRPDPAYLEVVRTNPASPAKRQVKPGSAHRTDRNFGLTGDHQLATIRFSGERPSPHESTTVRLIRPDDLLGHLGVPGSSPGVHNRC